MILRLLFALCSVAILAALLYLQDADNGNAESGPGEFAAPDPGFGAVHAHLIGALNVHDLMRAGVV